ncbi:hypothetical protein CPJ18_11430 [Agrobacterium rosae]|uniref:Uncharacterized protein n=1 Tax=Agrobacterium rosae TaxID=1972867 RepID=A0AAE5RXR8_9HYPH|nr:hypothetical protein DXM21_04615 [Agrobacterium rosae]KAA3522785.1 hypothetical protein DXM25_04620 [Agrobacterium rosae]MQB47455.1 hypothetical protein [Agrobacterium rosae]POO51169.1 hypothetical protein CPJ18_11430 [Agrobacterium rosae]
MWVGQPLFAIDNVSVVTSIQRLFASRWPTVKTLLLSKAFFAKIAEGLAKRKNSPYVSPRDADAAFDVRL